MNNRALNWCRRYISLTGLLLVGAIVYMTFFQENSMTRIYQNKKQIDSLQQAIAENTDTLQYYRTLNQNLDNGDAATIERIVRENHNMTLPDEDVYVFD